jgi:hypothetical protein
MAITQAMCTSFKKELLTATHNFSASGGDTFKMALFTSTATLDAATTAYAATNEVSGTNYVAGGTTLTNVDPSSSGGTTGFTQFGNATFSNVTITARGALIYNFSKSNKAVCVLDFGSDKTATAGDFVVTMPTNATSTALIRIA